VQQIAPESVLFHLEQLSVGTMTIMMFGLYVGAPGDFLV
jgi:hypothetical protein